MNDDQIMSALYTIEHLESKDELERFRDALSQRESKMKEEEQKKIEADKIKKVAMGTALFDAQRRLEAAAEKIYGEKFDSEQNSIYFVLTISTAMRFLEQAGCSVQVPSYLDLSNTLIEFCLDELDCNGIQQDVVNDVIIPISF